MALKIDGTVVVDDNGNGFFPNLALVEKPINISPANNASNVIIFPLLLTGSDYTHIYNVSHQTSLFEVSNSNTFATIVYTSGNVAANVSNTIAIQLDPDEEYYWRVQYTDSENVSSEFSDTTSFTTANAFISTPTLEVTGSPDAVIETPNLVTSSFAVTGSVAGVTAAHISTDWQVLRTSNSQIVFERPANTVNLTSIVVPAATLEANVQYEFKARHNANVFGSSEFASNTGTSRASFDPTVLGESFGGGFYTGTINIGGGVCYYLIVAPNSTGCICCRWKTTRNDTPGIALSCVNGFTNTFSLSSAAFPAGNWTATRTIAGFSDWYLPARDELNVLYTNAGSMPAGEGYASDRYWSSTLSSSASIPPNFDQACAQSFFDGVITRIIFTSTCRARAVRRIPI